MGFNSASAKTIKSLFEDKSPLGGRSSVGVFVTRAVVKGEDDDRAPEVKDDDNSNPKPPAPANPLLASKDLSLVPAVPPAAPVEQFQTEISAYVNVGGKFFIISSGGGDTIQVTDATNPSAPAAPVRTSLGLYTSQCVAAYGTLVAVALSPKSYGTTAGLGLVRFYRMDATGALTLVKDVDAGYLPDSLAFTGDGKKLVIANEGEPIANYVIDRPGSIGIIDIKGDKGKETFTYTDLGFAGVTLPGEIRISGPSGTTPQADMEPEFVSIDDDFAYVTVQENNGVVKVNLKTNTIEKIYPLGSVDFKNLPVDLSDRDGPPVPPSTTGTPLIKPLLGQAYEGLRMADGIAAFSSKGKDYFMTANEGDGREYGTSGTTGYYTDEARGSGNDRVKRLTDDAKVGSADRITTFGGRSVSIYDAITGAVVWDSGSTLQTVAIAAGVYDDTRSDDKGVEPEGVVVKELNGRTYAIVSLERTIKSMLVVFDITIPAEARFVTSTVLDGSVSPEGLLVVDAKDSPTKRDLLVVSNEVSNTLNFIDLEAMIAAPAVAGAGTFTTSMLKDVGGGPELKFTNLLTNGEFTNGTAPGSVYVPPGIFDGTGAYSNNDGTYTLLVNNELGSAVGYGYTVEGLDPVVTGARINSFIVDIDVDDNAANGFQSRIVSGGLAYDKVIGNDKNGFDRFCAATLVEANSFGFGKGFADRTYLTGEETSSAAYTGAPTGGAFYALDVNNKDLYEVKGFGRAGFESGAAIDTGSKNTVAVVLLDDQSGGSVPLYMWVGEKKEGGYLERNGMAAENGSLYAWKPSNLPDANANQKPDTADLNALKGSTPVSGSWVKLGTGLEVASKSAAELRTLAFSLGAQEFLRIEDGATNPLNGQQFMFVTTGGSGADNYGNVYTMSFTDAFGADGKLAPTGSSSLRVIADADRLTDPTTGLRSPDNLTWSADGFAYIQEDKSTTFGTQEASIWQLNPNKIDPLTGLASLERWAQIDRSAVPTIYGQSDSAPAEVGNWESSGIMDVSHLYNATPGTFFLGDVQAHSLTNGNIYGSGYLAEGGQIDLIQQIRMPLA